MARFLYDDRIIVRNTCLETVDKLVICGVVYIFGVVFMRIFYASDFTVAAEGEYGHTRFVWLLPQVNAILRAVDTVHQLTEGSFVFHMEIVCTDCTFIICHLLIVSFLLI